MDNELREAFATLSGQLSDIATEARAAHAIGKLNAHELASLKSYVYGSSPPPPPPPGAPPPPPLDEQVTKATARASSASLDVEELRGHLLRVESTVERIETQNKEQSKALGIGVQGFRWLTTTREGRSLVAAFAALVFAASSCIGAHPVSSAQAPPLPAAADAGTLNP